MSLTGKTINQLPLLTGYSATTYIPVYYSGLTYKSTYEDLSSYKKWSALLTQTGSFTYTSSTEIYGGLILGETYEIVNYVAGDDFSNVAQIISGVINTTGCIFKVTGDPSTDVFLPTTWDASELTSLGEMIVYEISNNLGFDVIVEYPGFGVLDGVVIFYPDVPTGGFNPQKTVVKAQASIPYDFSPTITNLLTSIDRQILAGVMYVIDPGLGPVSNSLNNTLVEIIVYKD